MFFKKEDKRGPQEVPSFLSRKIGENWGKLPRGEGYWVNYRMVTRPHPNKGEQTDFRIFDEGYANLKSIKVVDYATLDGYPDLVLLDGWFNKKSKEADVRLTKAA